MEKIKQINDQTLLTLYNEGRFNNDFLLIDIREVEEFQEEHIENSYNVPTFSIPHTDFSKVLDKTAIFLCRSGNRTRVYEHLLLNTGFKNLFCMDEGILQWKRCGLPTVK